jgi:predicted nuclease with TOPRIM domain
VKLISGDILGDDEQLLETLLTLRGELDEQEAKLEEARSRLDALPHRRSYLDLVVGLGERLCRVQREWLDEVERELGRPDEPR